MPYLHAHDAGFHASVFAVSGGTGELTAKEVEILVRNNQYRTSQWSSGYSSVLPIQGLRFNPGEGTKSPHALWCGKKLREKKTYY